MTTIQETQRSRSTTIYTWLSANVFWLFHC